MKHIKEFKDFITENVNYYGVDPDTERRAGVPRISVDTYHNADAFKREIATYFFTSKVKKELPKVTLHAGSKSNLTVKGKDFPNELELMNIFKDSIEWFKKVRSIDLILSDFTDKSFIISYK